jgi:hypothetical protein
MLRSGMIQFIDSDVISLSRCPTGQVLGRSGIDEERVAVADARPGQACEELPCCFAPRNDSHW